MNSTALRVLVCSFLGLGSLVAQSTSDRALVGAMSLSTYGDVQNLPLPAVVNQKFCTLIQLAPNVLTWAYVPTAKEKNGDFSNVSFPLIDPNTNSPFPGNLIPASRIPSPFAWRLPAAGPAPGESCVTVGANFPVFNSASSVTGLSASLDTLSPIPSSVNFSYRLGDPVQRQSFSVLAARTPLPYSITVSPPSGAQQPWISYNGGACCHLPGTIEQVGIIPSALVPGTYTGQLKLYTIGAISAPQTITVNATITAPPAFLQLSTKALSFQYAIGDPAPPLAQFFKVVSTGSATTFTTSPVYVTPPNVQWFHVIPPSGSSGSNVLVSIDPNIATQLGRGVFIGYLDIIAPGAPNSPQRVLLKLTVSPDPDFTITPDSLVFSYTSGGQLPSSQRFALQPAPNPVDNLANLRFNMTVTTVDPSDATWLTTPPSTGVPSLSSLVASVTPDAQCLAAGTTHQAIIAFNAPKLTSDDTDPNTAGTLAASIQIADGAAGSPDLSINMSHAGTFAPGQTGAQYTISVSNAGTCPVVAGNTVIVTTSPPAGLAPTALSGTGWACTLASGTCTRGDALAPSASYPPLSLTVNVASNAPASLVNTATVSGGGENNPANDTASDSTTVSGPAPAGATLSSASLSFGAQAVGTAGAPQSVTLTNTGSAALNLSSVGISGANAADFTEQNNCGSTVNAGGNCTITVGFKPSGTGQRTASLILTYAASTQQVVSLSGTGGAAAALQLLTVAPCRIMDTRIPPDGTFPPNTTFGSPNLAAGAVRSIPIPSSNCGVPANARAYSLNFTVSPRAGRLRSLTIWPGGQAQPNTSTITSPDGQTIANAAIVPAGADGSINAAATDDTDLIVDINGYFVPPGNSTLQFYPLAPCRVLDTRVPPDGTFPPNSTFGSPSLDPLNERSFPIPSSACGAPPNAAAYSLNVTTQPKGALGFLSSWPAATARPYVSTMNSYDGTVLANAAIVPAGNSGAVSFFASNPADVIVDINGYFAPPGAKGLNFYTVNPCRLVDTTNANGSFGGPLLTAGIPRSFPLSAGSCGLPPTPALQAYSLSIAATPKAPLGFLTVWPAGGVQPYVSTLNGYKGLAVSNAAIVPAGGAGAISLFVTTDANITIDTAGYFGQ